MQNFVLECMCREHASEAWHMTCLMYITYENWVPEPAFLRDELDRALKSAVDMWNLYATSLTAFDGYQKLDSQKCSRKRMKLPDNTLNVKRPK